MSSNELGRLGPWSKRYQIKVLDLRLCCTGTILDTVFHWMDDRLAVGAYVDGYGVSGGATGAVYVFKRTGATWVLEQEISDQSSGFTALLSQGLFWIQCFIGWMTA